MEQCAVNVAGVLLLIILPAGSAQVCLPGFPNPGGPQRHSPMLQRQLVIPHYTFSCNATVIEWEVLLHTHGRTQRLSRVDFQVWRLDRLQKNYYLVGSNSFSPDYIRRQQSIRIQGKRLVMEIEEPMHQISAFPGDIVGVFIRGERIELEYRSSRVAHTYQANLNGPLLERFSANLAQDPVFRRAIKGVPLIGVKTNNGIEATGIAKAPTISWMPSSALPTTGMSTIAVQSHVTDTDQGSTETGTASNSHQKHLIGGIIGGGVVVFIIASIVLGIVIRRRKHDRGNDSNQTSPDITQLSSSSESTLLSHLQLSTTAQRNLFAFKRRATARHLDKDRAKDTKSSKAETHKEPNNDIELKENLCYVRTQNCSTDTTTCGHEYDVPTDAKVQPCEYETPIDSSVKLENVYDTTTDREEQIYEEIKLS